MSFRLIIQKFEGVRMPNTSLTLYDVAERITRMKGVTVKQITEVAVENIGNLNPKHNNTVLLRCTFSIINPIANYHKKMLNYFHGEKSMDKIKTDHLGIEYKSQKAMCEFYQVSPSTFCKRLARYWTLQEALTGKRKVLFSKDGKEYYTQKEICDAFDIHPNTMVDKLNKGYSIEEIIERKTFRVKDHLGNKYKNTQEMCEKYGIKVPTYRARIRSGLSIKEALTK